jgi:hypothetical protein
LQEGGRNQLQWRFRDGKKVLLMGFILAAFSANAGRITMSNPEQSTTANGQTFVSIPTVFTPLPSPPSQSTAPTARALTRPKASKFLFISIYYSI